jgi:hypothetical protein
MTANVPAFTSNPPQIHHQKTTFCTPFFPKPPAKTPVIQPEKKLLQKCSLFGLGLGESEAGAEGLDQVGDVVVEEDAGEDVFGSVDGHGGVEEAGVAF